MKGYYFRLASENPFNLADIVNHTCHKLLPKPFAKRKECFACSISGFVSDDHILEFRDKMSRYSDDWQTYPVIRYYFCETDGVVLNTGGITEHHHDYWPHEGILAVERMVI
jgi:hypothetical protein